MSDLHRAEGAPPDVDAHDEACLRRMAAGEDRGIAQVYDRHSRAVYSLACRVLSDPGEAEDVVQDVFAQAWRQASRFDAERSSVRGWLLMMTRARSIDRLRARTVRAAVGGSHPDAENAVADHAPDPEAAAAMSQEARRVIKAMAELDPAQRTAVELAYYKGLTHTEIAETLGQPLGTVKTRVRTALMKLRDALGAAR